MEEDTDPCGGSVQVRHGDIDNANYVASPSLSLSLSLSLSVHVTEIVKINIDKTVHYVYVPMPRCMNTCLYIVDRRTCTYSRTSVKDTLYIVLQKNKKKQFS